MINAFEMILEKARVYNQLTTYALRCARRDNRAAAGPLFAKELQKRSTKGLNSNNCNKAHPSFHLLLLSWMAHNVDHLTKKLLGEPWSFPPATVSVFFSCIDAILTNMTAAEAEIQAKEFRKTMESLLVGLASEERTKRVR